MTTHAPEVSYLWGRFCELSAGRQSSGPGPQPQSYGDIAA